jgi:hypothetical protein
MAAYHAPEIHSLRESDEDRRYASECQRLARLAGRRGDLQDASIVSRFAVYRFRPVAFDQRPSGVLTPIHASRT